LIFITTVWHSGTHSLIDHIGKPYEQIHSSFEALEVVKKGDHEAWTTYRDPHRVAASWLNRGRWGADIWLNRWYDQWKYYHLIRPYAHCIPVEDLNCKVSTSDDKTGLHGSLDAGEYGKFYKAFPKKLIDYAIN